jgi:hypothetical protein
MLKKKLKFFYDKVKMTAYILMVFSYLGTGIVGVVVGREMTPEPSCYAGKLRPTEGK